MCAACEARRPRIVTRPTEEWCRRWTRSGGDNYEEEEDDGSGEGQEIFIIWPRWMERA